MAKYVVAPAREIAPGGRKLVEVKGRKIVIFNLKGEFFAVSDRCPHQGGPLSKGLLTGLDRCDPRRVQVRRFEVDVEAGAQLVQGPYVADTFPVAIEDDYLVVTL